MRIGKKEFDTEHKTYIMGILNITPDSFSDGGKFLRPDKALKHAEKMISEGADIIDIGGESTRPGYTVISEEEEIARTAPVIEAVKKNFDLPVSVDTCKSRVAKAAIEAGADMVNDIWGLRYDKDMASLIAETGVSCCLMHNRGNTEYRNIIEEIKQELTQSVHLAECAGIPSERILLDPGVGFGKTYEQNLTVIRHLDALQELSFPVLLGTSRKSVIGLTLDLPVDERIEGTIATTVLAVQKGCAFVRVHDVKENLRAIRMTEAILNG